MVQGKQILAHKCHLIHHNKCPCSCGSEIWMLNQEENHKLEVSKFVCWTTTGYYLMRPPEKLWRQRKA